MKKIVLTGGGTAGHVTPNIALAQILQQKGYKIDYIGSKTGIEKELIKDVPYHEISSGKLRRYVDMKNLSDAFKVVVGVGDAVKVLKKIKPDIIFSKGGFVTVPVVIAGKLLRIPIIIHESDMTPGLANRIANPFANTICVSFPETMQHLPKNKVILTGPPLREEIFHGDKQKGLRLAGFSSRKPILLVIGGSLGSLKINECVRNSLDKILDKFCVIHICGKGNKMDSIKKQDYLQFEYVADELADLLSVADVVISRAGSNAIYELLALKKPHLLIPLSKKASRGDQILNAQSFEKQGFSKVLQEEDMDDDSLLSNILEVHNSREQYISAMSNSNLKNGVQEIVNIIENCVTASH